MRSEDLGEAIGGVGYGLGTRTKVDPSGATVKIQHPPSGKAGRIYGSHQPSGYLHGGDGQQAGAGGRNGGKAGQQGDGHRRKTGEADERLGG